MELLVTEIDVNNLKWLFTWIYKPASQNHNRFRAFLHKSDLLLCSVSNTYPICLKPIGDFDFKRSS